MSSIIPAVWAKSSLTSIPLWPYFLNGTESPWPRRSCARSAGWWAPALPLWRSSIGLGSNVSTCDGPPFMNRWTTRLALARSGGALGKSGIDPVGGAAGQARRAVAVGKGRPGRRGQEARVRQQAAQGQRPHAHARTAESSRRVMTASSSRGAGCDIENHLFTRPDWPGRD